MSRIVTSTVFVLSLAWPCQSYAQLRVRDLMTSQQFAETGLAKLTPQELAALDRWFSATASAILQFASTSPTNSSDLSALEGATVVADDGEFLGKITRNSIDPQSIGNEIGRYGSSISPTSMFNSIGRYGSQISSLSPFNTITSTPPRIFKDGRFVAHLTANMIKSPRVDPHALIGWIRSNR